jgi:hypothetical protein
MTHAWCHDIARDAAVRAAEDNRTRPLPTLGECIDGMFPKSVSASSTADHENKGDGMRTERVTLEITRPAIANYPAPAKQFMWQHLLRNVVQGERESVRVVEDEETIPPAPVSRPAETRQTKAERVGGGWWFPKYDKPSAPPPPPLAPPRVHRGSGVVDADGDEVPWEGVVAAITAERDAAIRERDALRAARITQSLTADRFAAAVAEADKLRARVDELESRTSTPGEGWCAADAASGNSQASLDGSQAASGGGESIGRKLAERLGRFLDRLESGEIDMPNGLPTAESGGGGWHCARTSPPPIGEFKLCRWVTTVCGNRQVSYGEGARRPDGMWGSSNRVEKIPPEQWQDLPAGPSVGRERWEREAASGVGEHFADASKMVEQPRGWLSGDERLALDAARTIIDGSGRTNIGATIDDLLARSSPPEVVLPRVYCHGGDGEQLLDIKDVRAALAAAGVAVKETT